MRLTTVLFVLPLVAFGGSNPFAQEARENNAHSRARMARFFPDCALEEVPASDLFLAASVDEATTPTNLQFGPRTGASLALVDIEAGEQAITLALDMKPDQIIEFTGAVGRIRRVVAAAGRELGEAAIGVVGVEASRVRFLTSDECGGIGRMLGHAIRRSTPSSSDATMTAIFGREPDRRQHIGYAAAFSLPSFSGIVPFAPQQRGSRLVITQGRSDTEWQTVLE